MSDAQPKGSEKKRKMARKDWKILERLRKAVSDKKEELEKTLNDICDKHLEAFPDGPDWWADLIDIVGGFVNVEAATASKPFEPGVSLANPRERLEVSDRQRVRKVGLELRHADQKLGEHLTRTARVCNVTVRDLNISTGEITSKPGEYEECASTSEVEDVWDDAKPKLLENLTEPEAKLG